MKVGIVVPYSWSFWGAVVEHAESQADALRRLGFETRLIMGCDPPGSFTRVLHPRLGRHGHPPDDVIPVGRSVIVPANGSLPNIVLSPRSVRRIRSVLERERFDLLHLHEPMTPAICVAALALARTPVVATFHAAGGKLGWTRAGMRVWGFLLDRIDERIAVSEQARDAATSYAPGDYHIVPNGILIPPSAEAAAREHRVAFVGRHEPRKGLQVALRAWPEVRKGTGARLRVIGSDPLAVRLLLSRAFACATPVVASDIVGYRDVMTDSTGVAVPPDDPGALAHGIVSLLDDEPRRASMGAEARRLAEERYSWDEIARSLVSIYERALEREPQPVGARE